jgi:hypothetical protein
MSLDAWRVFFEIGGIVLLAATFIFGACAFLVNSRMNTIESRALAAFRLNFEGEQQKTARAQQEAAEAKALAAGFEREIALANQKSGEANERAAKLEVEAAKLREQLLAQAQRENLVSGEKRQQLVDMLKPFAGQRIDVRHSASTNMVNGGVVVSTTIGDDGLGLARSLIGALKDAGWNSPPGPLISAFQGQGLKVEIDQNASLETLTAAKVLVEALKKVPLRVEGPLLDDDVQAERADKGLILPAFDENTIILTVLAHP